MPDPSAKPAFDPLHRWLGIPPEEQPPNHYRLLGLKPLEGDPNVIEAAVDQRMAYVRQAAVGKNAVHSQTVLNLLSAARTCLLQPEKKAAYDADLRARLQAATPIEQPVLQAVPLSVLPSPQAAADGTRSVPATVAPASIVAQPRPIAKRKREQPWLLYGAGAIAALALMVVVGLIIASSGTSEPIAEKPNGIPRLANPQEPPLPKVEQPAPKEEKQPEAVSGPEAPAEPPELRLPVLHRKPGDKVLLICEQTELTTAIRMLDECEVPHLKAEFDRDRTDYSGVHAILVGMNRMDYWGSSNESMQPEAFNNIERFVREGGHLVVTGAFNGRNMEHLQRFGITTSFHHCTHFEEVPEHTKVFFKEAEHLIPPDLKLRSAGNFTVAGPHIVLLNRGSMCNQPGPALVTLAVDKGRLTFTQVEAAWKNQEWLIAALCKWMARGAPTRLDDEEIPLPEPMSKPKAKAKKRK
jgi:hypothetical protein